MDCVGAAGVDVSEASEASLFICVMTTADNTTMITTATASEIHNQGVRRCGPPGRYPGLSWPGDTGPGIGWFKRRSISEVWPYNPAAFRCTLSGVVVREFGVLWNATRPAELPGQESTGERTSPAEGRWGMSDGEG